jgi:hypothetical protein
MMINCLNSQRTYIEQPHAHPARRSAIAADRSGRRSAWFPRADNAEGFHVAAFKANVAAAGLQT